MSPNGIRIQQMHILFLLVIDIFALFLLQCLYLERRRVWRYQSCYQNPYIEEELITQWPKENVQSDKQRSTKHTYKNKDRVTRTPLKTEGELGCFGRVSKWHPSY